MQALQTGQPFGERLEVNDKTTGGLAVLDDESLLYSICFPFYDACARGGGYLADTKPEGNAEYDQVGALEDGFVARTTKAPTTHATQAESPDHHDLA